MAFHQRLFMAHLGRRVFSICIPGTNRNCLIGMTTQKVARKLCNHLSSTEQFIAAREDTHSIGIEEVDFEDANIYKTLKLNNLALLVTEDFVASESEIAFDGSLIDIEYALDDDHREYFERLYNKK